jgi:predicted nucleic acid-binding protein
MNRLYLDTNILIDHLLNREPFGKSASALLLHLAEEKALGFTSVINIVHAHYQLAKKVGKAKAREVVAELMVIIQPVEVPAELVLTALQLKQVPDFEDAVQWAICQHHRIDFLITRNGTDFPADSQPVVCDAEAYLKTYQTQA